MPYFKPKLEFATAEMKGGKGWCVRATPPNGAPVLLGSFKTEEEAREWIKHKSLEWLKEFEGGRHA